MITSKGYLLFIVNSAQLLSNVLAGLGEFKLRDINDEINKLLREKGHWEDRIKELGGPDYRVNAKTKLRISIQMSGLMGKPTICICETKGADQLRSNCEADQRLCFRYTDSTMPLLLESKISSF